MTYVTYTMLIKIIPTQPLLPTTATTNMALTKKNNWYISMASKLMDLQHFLQYSSYSKGEFDVEDI